MDRSSKLVVAQKQLEELLKKGRPQSMEQVAKLQKESLSVRTDFLLMAYVSSRLTICAISKLRPRQNYNL
jgi:hypothetical protein